MTGPIRALHVVGAMNRGGVETWLLNVLRRLPRTEVAIDLMVHTDECAAYDDEVAALGVTIHRNCHTRNPARYALRLSRLLRGSPSYDVVHSHVHHYSSIVLATAAAARVPVRVAHSHSDTRGIASDRSPWRRAYLGLSQQLIRRMATDGMACADGAGRALFGERWAEDGRWSRVCYGIDSAVHARDADRDGVRAELTLPVDAAVIVHVGRFDTSKNQTFLLDLLVELSRRQPNAFLVLVGSGPLEEMVATRAAALGVRDRVRFCGSRADVPRLLSCADAFVFPSLHEGLPLTCLEAQAAGLPVVMSDTITQEVIVAADRVSRLPLGAVGAWADATLEAVARAPHFRAAPPALSGGPFDIEVSVQTVLDVYRRAVGRQGAGGRTRPAPAKPDSGAVHANAGD